MPVEVSTRTLPPLSTGAWYDEHLLSLDVPASWRLRWHEPSTPPPLTQMQIEDAIKHPTGPPLRELARAARRPVIIVDDLTRPTPAELLLPGVLDELETGGVRPADVTIMLGTGTHGPASADAMRRKLGKSAAACRLAPHDDRGPSVRIGRTSFGSRVEIDPAVAEGDLLIAIGGVYPQNTAAFGGGAKAVLGVLGRRSIEDLHFGHGSDDGRYNIDNDFRRDIEEMAALAGLAFSVSVLVDQHRRVVKVDAGKHGHYYRDAVSRALTWFAAPRPSTEDVVIANAFPMDVSATFMRSKGIIPLLHTVPGASRVLIAACPEGVGHHGLFPLRPATGMRANMHLLQRQMRYAPASVPRLVLARAMRVMRHQSSNGSSAPVRNQVICFVTDARGGLRSGDIPGMRVVTEWSEVLRQIEREQAERHDLSVAIYPCSPLQVLRSGDDA